MWFLPCDAFNRTLKCSPTLLSDLLFELSLESEIKEESMSQNSFTSLSDASITLRVEMFYTECYPNLAEDGHNRSELKYACHCTDFHKTHNYSTVLRGDFPYNTSIKTIYKHRNYR